MAAAQMPVRMTAMTIAMAISSRLLRGIRKARSLGMVVVVVVEMGAGMEAAVVIEVAEGGPGGVRSRRPGAVAVGDNLDTI